MIWIVCLIDLIAGIIGSSTVAGDTPYNPLAINQTKLSEPVDVTIHDGWRNHDLRSRRFRALFRGFDHNQRVIRDVVLILLSTGQERQLDVVCLDDERHELFV